MTTDSKLYPSYELHKAKAKERYHNDPEYRARKKAYAKKWQEEALKDPEYRLIQKIKRKERYKRKILGITK